MEIQYQTYYFVYIVTDQQKTLLKVGITIDMEEQLNSLQEQQGCYNLLYCEKYTDIAFAMKRETKLKSFSQKKLKKVINDKNPEWKPYNRIDFLALCSQD